MLYFRRHVLMNEAGADGGAGGAGAAGGDGGGNSQGNFEGNSLNPWKLNVTMSDSETGRQGDAPANGGTPQLESQQGSQSGENQQERYRRYIDGLGLLNGVDTAPIQRAVNQHATEDNPDPMGAAMTAVLGQVAENVFVTTMRQIGGVLDKRIPAAIDTAVERAQSGVTRDAAMAELAETMPFANTPEMQPMVQQVLEGFMAQTKGNRQQAVKMTGEFFENAARSMGEAFRSPNTNGRGGGARRSQGQQNDAPDEPSFLDIFGTSES